MYGYETPPSFRTDGFLSAHDVNVLVKNAIALDGLANRIEAAFDSTGAYGDQVSLNLHPLGDFLLWRGGLRWVTGYTGLVVGGRAASFGTTDLLVTINGVLKATYAAATTWGSTIDISTGYTAGQILDIRITTSGNASKTSEFVVFDVYATPAPTIATTWPGALPTFAGTYSAANLQKLSTACDYLYETIAACPLVPHLAHIWRNGTHKAQEFTLWTGTLLRTMTAEQIRIKGNVTVNTTTEELKIQVDGDTGSSLTTLGPWTAGQTVAFNQAIAYPTGVGVGEYVEITITASVSAPVAPPYPANSLYNLTIIRSEPTIAAETAPGLAVSNVNVTATSVNGGLNAIGTLLSGIKARLDASPAFARGRAHRYKFAVDDHQAAKFARTYPHTFIRRGARLIVSGKNITLGFGAITFEHDEDGATDYAKFKWATEQSLIGGETIETQTVYLDSIKGLFVGTTYQVFGDVVYAGEYL
jgi:hypothetical protein